MGNCSNRTIEPIIPHQFKTKDLAMCCHLTTKVTIMNSLRLVHKSSAVIPSKPLNLVTKYPEPPKIQTDSLLTVLINNVRKLLFYTNH